MLTDVWEDVSPPSSRLKISQARNQLIFNPEDGGDMFLQNVGSHTDYMVL
jgi:hypothetical protein